VCWIDHVVPFHRSASDPPLLGPVISMPTAVQALADAHDTPARPLPCTPVGLGVCWIDHVVPFHRSASVTVVVLVEVPPTAVQALADVHDTPCRRVFDPPVGLGVCWIDHLVPFHRSASAPLEEAPTAVQALADVHDTLYRKVNDEPVGLGVCWIDHLLPFQRSASVTVVVPLEEAPTAVQALADVHDTPFRMINDPPVGLGVCWIDHVLPFQPSASVTPVVAG
jgi:hypothetical protein